MNIVLTKLLGRILEYVDENITEELSTHTTKKIIKIIELHFMN